MLYQVIYEHAERSGERQERLGSWIRRTVLTWADDVPDAALAVEVSERRANRAMRIVAVKPVEGEMLDVTISRA
jgi:hypothetical protein